MANLFNTQDFDVDLGNAGIAAIAALGPLHLATIDLVGINGPWGRAADYAALKAGINTYTGYAQGVITFDPPSLDSFGNVELVGISISFRCTAVGPAQTAYGILIQNAANTKMYLNGPLDTPADFSGPLDQLTIIVRWYPATKQVSVQIG